MPTVMEIESDLSEMEQQQEFLDGEARVGRKGLSKGMLATVGTVLLGATVLAVLYARPSAAVGAPGAANGLKTAADLIQAYALKKHGRPLTQLELTAVQGNVAQTRYGHLARPRSLEEEADGDDEVSSQCKQLIKDMAEDVFGKVMTATMEAVKPCNKDPYSQDCKEMTKKVYQVEEEFTSGCKVTGDVCTLTDKLGNGEVIEEKEICMPKECHANPSAANAWAEENVSPREPGSLPDNSTTTVACGVGGTPEAESKKPDFEFLGSNETDGKVHPEVEVWEE